LDSVAGYGTYYPAIAAENDQHRNKERPTANRRQPSILRQNARYPIEESKKLDSAGERAAKEGGSQAPHLQDIKNERRKRDPGDVTLIPFRKCEPGENPGENGQAQEFEWLECQFQLRISFDGIKFC
jgi:hypothetical protein